MDSFSFSRRERESFAFAPFSASRWSPQFGLLEGSEAVEVGLARPGKAPCAASEVDGDRDGEVMTMIALSRLILWAARTHVSRL